MKRSNLLAYAGLLIVGVAATAALLLEARLSVSRNVHFLLQLLWLGIAMGGVFIAMVHPAVHSSSRHELTTHLHEDDVPEWRDPDRLWLQQHPDEPYLASDGDNEGTQ